MLNTNRHSDNAVMIEDTAPDGRRIVRPETAGEAAERTWFESKSRMLGRLAANYPDSYVAGALAKHMSGKFTLRAASELLGCDQATAFEIASAETPGEFSACTVIEERHKLEPGRLARLLKAKPAAA